MSPAENKTLREMDRRLARIETAVVGNGTKGLAERVDEIEKWQRARPRACPAARTRRQVITERAVTISGTALGIAGIELVLKLVGVL